MKILILADIHSNLNAFQACLEDVKSRGGFDIIWSLGDVVGYGPQPNECIALLHQFKHISIAGNHDRASVNKLDIAEFNPEAAAACLWTAGQLGEQEKKYILNLPATIQEDDFTLVHGSPRAPVWEYLVSASLARMNFTRFQTKFCLVGHSHIPLLFDYSDKTTNCRLRKLPKKFDLNKTKRRLIINPGGVGQPRDADSRASYIIYDRDSGIVNHFRVDYDIESTQRMMEEKGLPESLIGRLSYGL